MDINKALRQADGQHARSVAREKIEKNLLLKAFRECARCAAEDPSSGAYARAAEQRQKIVERIRRSRAMQDMSSADYEALKSMPRTENLPVEMESVLLAVKAEIDLWSEIKDSVEEELRRISGQNGNAFAVVLSQNMYFYEKCKILLDHNPIAQDVSELAADRARMNANTFLLNSIRELIVETRSLDCGARAYAPDDDFVLESVSTLINGYDTKTGSRGLRALNIIEQREKGADARRFDFS